MKRMILAAAALVLAGAGSPVLAKGCLKGAAMGAVGGHMVGKGHAVAGAAAGCAVGHHHASKKAAAKWCDVVARNSARATTIWRGRSSTARTILHASRRRTAPDPMHEGGSG